MTSTLVVLLLVCLLSSLPALSPVMGQQAGVPCGSISCLNRGTCVNNMCDCTGTMYTGVQCETLAGSVVDCPMDASAGLLWKPSQPGALSSVSLKACRNSFAGLQGGAISRTCTNGTWSSLDYSECLVNADQTNNKAFMLLWIPLAIDEQQLNPALPQIKTEIYQLLGVDPSLPLSLLRTVVVSSPSIPYLSATFLLLLPDRQPSPALVASLSESGPEFEAGRDIIGGLPSVSMVSWGIQGFYEADTCLCIQPTNQLFLGLCENIIPLPACPCDNGQEVCECFFPYFIGDGDSCTVDEDGDGHPNIPLEICSLLTVEQRRNVTYCTADNCPSHYNPTQDQTICSILAAGFDGCLMEEDEIWEIYWGNTLTGETDRERCPGGPGFITRMCGVGGWEPADASNCGSYQYAGLRDDISAIFDDDDFDRRLQNSIDIFDEVTVLTFSRDRRVSILPSDLDIVNDLINTILELLEEIQEGELQLDVPDFSVVDIMSNVLASTNLNGWISAQQTAAGSRQLLDLAERYGIYVSRTVGDEDNARRLNPRDNLVLSYSSTNPDNDGDHSFPETDDDVNGTFATIPAQITIPQAFLREQMGANRMSVPVSTILYRNMGRALPVGKNATEVASMVISTQISQRGIFNSPSLLTNPIIMKFVFDAVTANTTQYYCAFWQFSNPVGSGSWKTDGVAMMSQELSADNTTMTVTCNATHLTSFAVLVDLSGTLNSGDTGVSQTELLALQIVSYIGCAISLVCLLATIIFFLVQGSELFRKVHYFIHLNLSISLFLGYLMFVAGIETARVSHGACVFVAVWLHYFFLSSFSWMLCEGVMLYLMLVVVFSKLSKRWWFFLLLGYGIPVVPVAVTVGVSTAEYGVYTNGTLQYCWLPTSNGVIWGFVGPMLAIIMVNLVFLVIALVTVYRSVRSTVKRGRMVVNKKKKESENMNRRENKTVFVKLFTGTVVLLPLLGVTWVLGIFTVNANTTLFAWLFTIFNSLQGLFIFFFHVLRSDKVWNSSKAQSARHTLRKQMTRTSLKAPSTSNKRFTLERNETTVSILNSDVSTNQNISFIENSSENLLQDPREKLDGKSEVPTDTVTVQKTNIESKIEETVVNETEEAVGQNSVSSF